MTDQINVKPGDEVVFTGFASDDIPDNGDLLEEGETYVVDSINEGDEETEPTVNLLVPNPNYDPKKRKTKNNKEYIIVDVFSDEFALAGEEEAGEEAGEETEADTIDFDDVEKGMVVTVTDTEGEELTGTVFKKTKTLLGIEFEEDDETVEAVYKKKEIESIVAAAEEEQEAEAEEPEAEEEEQEEKPAKKQTKKKAAKKKASKKADTKKKESKKSDEEDDEDLKGLIILQENEEDPEVLEIVEEASDLCEVAEEMAEEAAVQDFRLGGILYHVRISKAFREIKDGEYNVKGGFQQYVEKELGIGYRKAMYLIDIYTKWSRFGLDASKVAEIGWTKAQEIARVMDEENAEQLVELAEESTVTELKETIKESFSKQGKDTREVVRKVTFKFRLAEDAAKAVEGYLEMAAEQLGAKKPEEVFEHIVTEWAQEHLDVSATKRVKKTAASSEKAAKKTTAKKTTAKKSTGRKTTAGKKRSK